jgi:hypothetical protein
LRTIAKLAMTEVELDPSEWQPVPLELPIELPILQTPPRPESDPDADAPRGRVIVIDLA